MVTKLPFFSFVSKQVEVNVKIFDHHLVL